MIIYRTARIDNFFYKSEAKFCETPPEDGHYFCLSATKSSQRISYLECDNPKYCQN